MLEGSQRHALHAWLLEHRERYPWVHFPAEIAAAERFGHRYPCPYDGDELVGFVKLGVDTVHIHNFERYVRLPEGAAFNFDTAYLKCGLLEEGFLRVRCEQCHAEKLVAFSCKKRGFCPSCGAMRIAETTALLADEVLPNAPLRQWVLSPPHGLRFLLATEPAALTRVVAGC